MSQQKPEQYVIDFVRDVMDSLRKNYKFLEEVRVSRGWADGVFGSVLIEAKAPGKRDRSAQEQLHNYMREAGYRIGLLIDIPTETYYHHVLNPYLGRVGFEIYLDDKLIVKREYNKNELDKAREDLKAFLKMVTEVKIARVKPTPENLLDKVSNLVEKWEKVLLNIASKGISGRISVYYNIWLRNMKLIYSADVIESLQRPEDLFVKLSIYVTLLKALGFTIAESMLGGGKYTVPMRLSAEGHKAAVELFWERKALTRFNINYLIERDEYDWVFAPEVAASLDGFFRDIGNELLEIDWSEDIELDLLKRIYQRVVPREMRKTLGEYYTPDWVAKLILWRALHVLVNGSPPQKVMSKDVDREIVELIDKYYNKYHSIPRFIDPTCGSFTFGVQYLSALVRWYLEKRVPMNPVDFARTILQSVVGIDLNPVATITAKVNYLLQIHRLLMPQGQYLYEEPMIPIYRADLTVLHMASKSVSGGLDMFFGVESGKYVVYVQLTGLVPEEKIEELKKSGIAVQQQHYCAKRCVEYIKLEVPRSIVNKIGDTLSLHRAFFGLLERGVEGFEAELKNRALKVQLSDSEKSSLENIYNVVKELEGRGLDTVWHSLVMNIVFAVLTTQNRFNLVLGNLPWVNVSKYPDYYREILKDIAEDLGVSPPPQAAKKLDISAILFAVSTKYLLDGKNGVVALMVPVSIFRGLHGAGWRNFVKKSLDLLEVMDLEDVKPFEEANNQPGIVLARGRP